MTLIKREIRATIILGSGSFGEGKGNTVTLEGYRVHADVVKGGLPSLDSANIRIYGVSQSIMNTVTRLGRPYSTIRNNTVTIEAGDAKNGLAQVFTGIMVNAYGDFGGIPEACIQITANAGLLGLVKPVSPISYPDGADVATIMAEIAASMGLSFINSGVSARLPTCYFPGTAIDQMRAVAKAANVNAIPNGGPNGQTLEIWPMDGVRGGQIPTIGPDTGLVGYPQYSDLGVEVTTLYTPGLAFGGQFNLETSVLPAKGLWKVLRLAYELQSETPGGAWFNHILATRPASAGGADTG